MTEDQKKKMMERLKKLLALSRSANENEAAAALAKAQELMRELAISEDDLELVDYAAVEADALLVRPGFRIPVYVSMLRSLITKAFGWARNLKQRSLLIAGRYWHAFSKINVLNTNSQIFWVFPQQESGRRWQTSTVKGGYPVSVRT